MPQAVREVEAAVDLAVRQKTSAENEYRECNRRVQMTLGDLETLQQSQRELMHVCWLDCEPFGGASHLPQANLPLLMMATCSSCVDMTRYTAYQAPAFSVLGHTAQTCV